MRKLHLLFLFLLASLAIYAQNPEWINYTNRQYVQTVVVEGDFVWLGTGGGLVKLNKTTGEKTFFNTGNSGLPSNSINSIAIDGSGNKWIGTANGLAKFDGTNWTVYNASNSGLPDNYIYYLTIDGSGNKWIGNDGGGCISFKKFLSCTFASVIRTNFAID